MIVAADVDRPAPGSRTAADVRRALWGVYVPILRRYVSQSPGRIAARSLVRESDGWSLTEPDALCTAELVKALFLLDACHVPHGVPTAALFDALVSGHLSGDDYQVIALALWAAALGRRSESTALFSRLRACLTASTSVTQSMGLGWALSAVCRYEMISGGHGQPVAFARELADRLLLNQAPSGLFYASARREGWLRRKRADATLSSQTYAIGGLAAFAEVTGDGNVASAAARCADRLCSLQGPQGQWWWQYDVARGTVRNEYPVYAVNQDGAVPAAFGALQRVLGDRRYDAAIASGLHWEADPGEVKESLIDERWRFVARSVERIPNGYSVQRELYAYQPARFIVATLSDPVWSAEVTT
jgi:hypothetical protein